MAEEDRTGAFYIPNLLEQAAQETEQRQAKSREKVKQKKRIARQKEALKRAIMSKTNTPTTPTSNPEDGAAAVMQSLAQATKEKAQRRDKRTALLAARQDEDNRKDDEDHAALLAASREMFVTLQQIHTPANGTPASSRGSSRSSSPTPAGRLAGARTLPCTPNAGAMHGGSGCRWWLALSGGGGG